MPASESALLLKVAQDVPDIFTTSVAPLVAPVVRHALYGSCKWMRHLIAVSVQTLGITVPSTTPQHELAATFPRLRAMYIRVEPPANDGDELPDHLASLLFATPRLMQQLQQVTVDFFRQQYRMSEDLEKYLHSWSAVNSMAPSLQQILNQCPNLGRLMLCGSEFCAAFDSRAAPLGSCGSTPSSPSERTRALTAPASVLDSTPTSIVSILQSPLAAALHYLYLDVAEGLPALTWDTPEGLQAALQEATGLCTLHLVDGVGIGCIPVLDATQQLPHLVQLSLNTQHLWLLDNDEEAEAEKAVREAAAVELLAKHTQLQQVSLHTSGHMTGVSCLQALTCLTSLDLSTSAGEDSDMSWIDALTGLHSLNYCGAVRDSTQMSWPRLAATGRLKELSVRELCAGHCRCIASLSSLTYLSLEFWTPRVRGRAADPRNALPAAVTALAGLGSLLHLHLGGCTMAAPIAEVLSSLRQLTRLSLRSRVWQHVSAPVLLPRVQYLALEGDRDGGPGGVGMQLVLQVPQLRVLSANCMTQPHVLQLGSLRELDCDEVQSPLAVVVVVTDADADVALG